MKNYLYVFLDNDLDVWDNLNSAIEHYLRIYYCYPRDLHNPKYMSIAKQLQEGKHIINKGSGSYHAIVDHTSFINERDIGIFIRFFDKSYSEDEIKNLWVKRFAVIKNIASEFNVSFREFIPLKDFKEEDFEKFYKRVFESFNIKIETIDVIKTSSDPTMYKAIINNTIELRLLPGDRYESISKKIDELKEKTREKETDLEEEYEK